MKRTIICTAVAALAFGQPAHAQFAVTVLPSIIGNTIANMQAAGQESACMAGADLGPLELAEAREPATAVMVEYFAAAQANAPKSPSFHLDSKTKWKSGQTSLDQTRIDQAQDPLAAAGSTLLAKPLRFYRSGDSSGASGQWAVQDKAGIITGVYTGQFTRKTGLWKLRQLTVLHPGEKVEPAMQFCHIPGDVTSYRQTSTKAMREYATKRVSKAETRVAAAAAKAEASQARAAAKPDSGSLQQQAAVDRDQASRLAAELEQRHKDLAEAMKQETEAQENAALVQTLTVDVNDATKLAAAHPTKADGS